MRTPTAQTLLTQYPGQVLGSQGLCWQASTLRSRVQAWQARLASFIQPWAGQSQATLGVAVQADNHPELLALDLATQALGLFVLPLPSFFTPAQVQHALGLPVHKITFTSGTTGQPKGVALSWAQQLRLAQQLHSALASLRIQRHLCVLPWPVLLENIAGGYAPMLHGANVALPSLAEIGWQGASKLDMACMVACMQTYQAQSVVLMPGMLMALVTHLERTQKRQPTLRCIAVGGGHTPVAVLQRAAALGLPVYEGYGLSECASVVCLNTPEAQRLGSVGKPLAGNVLRVDEHGELWVQGQGCQGYWQDLCEHRSSTLAPQGWTATGDIAEMDGDGYVYIRGRKKNIIITAMGRNVCPEWPEQLLLNTGVFAHAGLYLFKFARAAGPGPCGVF